MCAERVPSLQKILQHLAERQPKIVLHRVEKIYPSLKENLVSVLCLNTQETVLLSWVRLFLDIINEAPCHENVWRSGGIATLWH
jgi:hypothetical protein